MHCGHSQLGPVSSPPAKSSHHMCPVLVHVPMCMASSSQLPRHEQLISPAKPVLCSRDNEHGNLQANPHSRSPCSSRAMLILYTISAKKVAVATCRAGSLR
ncbi:unnamed protein product, partial [Musa acuminata subsp. burmannicoides]